MISNGDEKKRVTLTLWLKYFPFIDNFIKSQDKKRQIQLLNKSLLGEFLSEFDRLITE